MNKILQKQFEKFHENIKLKNFAENKKLKEKRDSLLKEIHDYFDKKYANSDEKKPTFYHINQGSYAVGMGVKPTGDDDYDIDVGIAFNISKKDYEPVELKELVKEALEHRYNRQVEMKRPCVRVQYTRNGKPHYHVDLAIYSDGKSNTDGQTYLARGYSGSKEKYKFWEKSNPKELKNIISNKFSNSQEQTQFRRIIRYLKRWKDLRFRGSGQARPTGIALTALALDFFEPKTYNSFTFQEEINDLKAITCFVEEIINQFSFWTGRIVVKLPVEPRNDLFKRMSDKQMENFKKELKTLKEKLSEAETKVDPVEACEILQTVFGSDFEIPSNKDTSIRTTFPAIASSSEQA